MTEEFEHCESSAQIYRGDNLMARLFIKSFDSEEQLDAVGRAMAYAANMVLSAPADAPLTHAQLEGEDAGDVCESQKVRA